MAHTLNWALPHNVKQSPIKGKIIPKRGVS